MICPILTYYREYSHDHMQALADSYGPYAEWEFMYGKEENQVLKKTENLTKFSCQVGEVLI